MDNQENLSVVLITPSDRFFLAANAPSNLGTPVIQVFVAVGYVYYPLRIPVWNSVVLKHSERFLRANNH